MNKRVVGIIVVTLFTVGIAYAGGTVTEHTFFSEALGTEQTALVYLPENYQSSGLEYPVVYLLHGADGGIGAWYLWALIPALDEMIDPEHFPPAPAVSPRRRRVDCRRRIPLRRPQTQNRHRDRSRSSGNRTGAEFTGEGNALPRVPGGFDQQSSPCPGDANYRLGDHRPGPDGHGSFG